MSKRSGFTLMELLLVIAILAIVAAVAAPQFFKTASTSIDEAKKARFIANYSALKAAINMYLWDSRQAGSSLTSLASGSSLPGPVSTTNSRVKRLVEGNYIPETATYYENANGAKKYFSITDPVTTVGTGNTATAPSFMETQAVFHVVVDGLAAGDYGTKNSIEEYLQTVANTDLNTLWEAIKAK